MEGEKVVDEKTQMKSTFMDEVYGLVQLGVLEHGTISKQITGNGNDAMQRGAKFYDREEGQL